MIKHPKDRLERRSASAHALELRQYRQRKINGKVRKYKTEIEAKETEDELHSYRDDDLFE